MNHSSDNRRRYSRRQQRRMFHMIMKNTYAEVLLSQFLAGYFIVAFIIRFVEPGIHSYIDALWYLFAASTTVGFGDITAVTLIGRLLTVYITISGILVVAIVPAVMVNYYQEVIQLRQKESVTAFMEKLEHLPELSKEELEEISERVKNLSESGGR